MPKHFVVIGGLIVGVGLAFAIQHVGKIGNRFDPLADAAQAAPILERLGPTTLFVKGGQENSTKINSAIGLQVIVFDDGTPIQIEWKQRPIDQLGLLYPEKLMPAYESLVTEASSGNPDAAFLLFRTLEDCKRSYTSKSSLDKEIDSVRQTHSYVRPQDGRRVKLSRPDIVESAVRNLSQRFEFCEGISDQQKNESQEWLESAMDLGHPEALYEYGTKTLPSAESVKALEELWLQGEPKALPWLSSHYEKGSPELMSGSSELTPAKSDLVLAYAYLYLNNLLMAASSEAFLNSPAHAQMLELSRGDLEHLSAHLSPSELLLAQEQAKELLESNEGCCFGH